MKELFIIYITMIYRLFLIIILTSFPISSLAGEKRYRIEILVLTHLHHEAVPTDTEWLRDFSSALDFLKIEEEEETSGDEVAPELPVADAEITGVASDELPVDENQPEVPWADVIAVEDKSDEMREAWRRMRLSAPFRPEQYLSWEQSADEPFPTLRIHDQEILLVDDPYAELREPDVTGTEDGSKPHVFSDQGNLLPASDTEETSGESEDETELPDPTLFYRIDGTVRLKRTRFLHLELDLEIRQAVFDEQKLAANPILSNESEAGEPQLPLPTSFLIHNLNQSRQVKSRHMEYFDSPVLGVLAWITPFELEDEAESLPE